MAAAEPLLARTILRFQHQSRIPLRGHVREKANFLDDVAHAAAETDEGGLPDASSVDQNFPAGWLDHAVHGSQQRGFAGAAAAEDGGGRAFFDCERNVVEKQPAVGGREADVAEFDGCGHGLRDCSSVGVNG